jgi:hypothetical protein
MQNIKRAI